MPNEDGVMELKEMALAMLAERLNRAVSLRINNRIFERLKLVGVKFEELQKIDNAIQQNKTDIRFLEEDISTRILKEIAENG